MNGFVRTKESSIGLCFVTMVAYMMTKYLQEAWSKFGVTVQEGLPELSAIVVHELIFKVNLFTKKFQSLNQTKRNF